MCRLAHIVRGRIAGTKTTAGATGATESSIREGNVLVCFVFLDGVDGAGTARPLRVFLARLLGWINGIRQKLTVPVCMARAVGGV